CGASIRAVEQLANLECRLAVKKWVSDPRCFNDSRATIEAQIGKLESLISTVGETSERRALIGSSYKRLAHIASDKPTRLCEQALKKMEKAYKEASELEPNDSYPLSNYLVAQAARLLRTNDPEEIPGALPELNRLVEQADNLVQTNLQNSPDDIWAANGVLDIRLIDYMVKYMWEGSQEVGDGVFDDLFEKYQITWQRFGSAREINSVIEHYAFLRAVLKVSESRKKLLDLLEKMLSSLKSIAA
ncbi:MAG: tetratricopeptide repeat-containing protein, partial [Chloroflexota bacterium]